MAFIPRKWQDIQQYIKYVISQSPVLSAALTSTSPVAHWNLWTFIQALASNLNEQAGAVLIQEIEDIIATGHAGTAPWIQSQILLFQYNVNSPYLLTILNNVPTYPNIVPNDRIISNCAVVVGNNGSITVKVTTGNPAGALNASQLTALASYLTNFLAPNQAVTIISTTADKLWIAGTVYYNGQLNASIQTSVINALNTYITQFSTSQASGGSFNGLVKVSDIEKVILSVPGVTDWAASQITVTPAVGSVFNLILASNQSARSYQTYSGYVKEDPGNLFTATLTFVPASN